VAQWGDEWSQNFGGTEALWFFVLYPRIHRFLPARNVLEIAPGFGRWTRYLGVQCQSLTGVDISGKCVEHCKARFVSEAHMEFHVNDGMSLDVVPDGSIDFVFSFDSLVHAECDVMEAYLAQLARKLSPEGIGFIHHSNIGSYPGRLKLMNWYMRLPEAIRISVLKRELMSKLFSINFQAGRARSMTAVLFRDYCHKAGLTCIRQELINWTEGSCLIDALSVFTRPNSRWDVSQSYIGNSDFVASGQLTSYVSRLYCS
jgi:ubiquinone/menaquinone biosynthesis C-methylase UbiE